MPQVLVLVEGGRSYFTNAAEITPIIDNHFGDSVTAFHPKGYRDVAVNDFYGFNATTVLQTCLAAQPLQDIGYYCSENGCNNECVTTMLGTSVNGVGAAAILWWFFITGTSEGH